MRILLVCVLASTCACSWFGAHKRPSPDPTEIVVTGAPRGSIILVDGVATGQTAARNDQSQILDVTAGAHKVEVQVGEVIVYREDTYVGPGEQRLIVVLSGSAR